MIVTVCKNVILSALSLHRINDLSTSVSLLKVHVGTSITLKRYCYALISNQQVKHSKVHMVDFDALKPTLWSSVCMS